MKAVAPITSSSEDADRRIQHWTTTVQGTTADWLTVRGRTLAEGRFIDNQDISDHTAVAVLGATTASELFNGVDPVGQTVDVNGGPADRGGRADLDRIVLFVQSTSDPDDLVDDPDHHGRAADLRRDPATP